MVMSWALQLLLSARASHGRCRICGTRLCPEDAITVAGSEFTHAECFLVHLLQSPDHPRLGLVESGAGEPTADVLRETLAQTFTRL
jgi:hypothetical protein